MKSQNLKFRVKNHTVASHGTALFFSFKNAKKEHFIPVSMNIHWVRKLLVSISLNDPDDISIDKYGIVMSAGACIQDIEHAIKIADLISDSAPNGASIYASIIDYPFVKNDDGSMLPAPFMYEWSEQFVSYLDLPVKMRTWEMLLACGCIYKKPIIKDALIWNTKQEIDHAAIGAIKLILNEPDDRVTKALIQEFF